MITRNSHQEVCKELEVALSREKQAQTLLQEQNRRINDLAKQLDRQITSGDDKEQTLAEAVDVSSRLVQLLENEYIFLIFEKFYILEST